jgi:hypothetical protein
MTGPALGAPALAEAQSGAGTVLTVLAETVANNIAFFLLVAAVGVGVFVVMYIMRRMTHIHRG